MKDFYSNFTSYKNCVPPGVRLPEIDIEKKYYKQLSLKENCSNYAFLKALCNKSMDDKEPPGWPD